MSHRYVLAVTGFDRVGVLAALTTALAELGADLHESRVSVLDPWFALLLTADFPEPLDKHIVAPHIEGVCRPFAAQVRVFESAPSGAGMADVFPEPSAVYYLTLTGRDSPGLMRHVSARLAQEGIGIGDLYGCRGDAGQVVALVLQLLVPQSAAPAELAETLAEWGATVDLEIQLLSQRAFPIHTLADAAHAAARRNSAHREALERCPSS